MSAKDAPNFLSQKSNKDTVPAADIVFPVWWDRTGNHRRASIGIHWGRRAGGVTEHRNPLGAASGRSDRARRWLPRRGSQVSISPLTISVALTVGCLQEGCPAQSADPAPSQHTPWEGQARGPTEAKGGKRPCRWYVKSLECAGGFLLSKAHSPQLLNFWPFAPASSSRLTWMPTWMHFTVSARSHPGKDFKADWGFKMCFLSSFEKAQRNRQHWEL